MSQLSRAQLAIVSALAGILSVGIIAAIGAALVVANGWFDISASTPHSRIASWLLHTTMIHSVQLRSKQSPAPVQFSDAQVAEGFKQYDSHCVMCHGGPGVSRSRWVMGINPPPPYIIDAARRWTPQELHFIIANGVKMTAMPSWKLSLSQEQITSLVAFLEKLPDISPAQYETLRGSAAKPSLTGSRTAAR